MRVHWPFMHIYKLSYYLYFFGGWCRVVVVPAGTTRSLCIVGGCEALYGNETLIQNCLAKLIHFFFYNQYRISN